MRVLVLLACLALVHGQKNLVELAIDLGLTTAADYLIKAGLDGALQGTDTFTLFIPNNDAFAALPEDIKAVLDGADTTILSAVLGYHAVPGSKIMSQDLENNLEAETLNAGKKIRINICIGEDGKPIYTATNRKIISADNEASNGVIHVIKNVMMVPEGNAMDFLSKENFSTLKDAVNAAELSEALAGDGPYTLFAPTNDAFEKIDPLSLQKLLSDKEKLKKVLLRHVLAESVGSNCVKDKAAYLPLGDNKPLVLYVADGDVKINNAMVVYPDKSVTNGVVHAVDEVIMEDKPECPKNPDNPWVEGGAPPMAFTSMVAMLMCLLAAMLA